MTDPYIAHCTLCNIVLNESFSLLNISIILKYTPSLQLFCPINSDETLTIEAMRCIAAVCLAHSYFRKFTGPSFHH